MIILMKVLASVMVLVLTVPGDFISTSKSGIFLDYFAHVFIKHVSMCKIHVKRHHTTNSKMNI